MNNLKYRLRYLGTVDELNKFISSGIVEVGDIVFIEETKQIWTHSNFFGSIPSELINIIDDLKSVSSTDALSANQGRILDKIKANKVDLESKADLIDGVIDMDQLPEKVQKCAYYLGVWDANSNSPVLNNRDSYDEGTYFIVREPGTRFGMKFYPSDLIIKANGTWTKICGSNYCKELEERIDSLEDRLTDLEEKVDNIISGGEDPGDLVTIRITSFTMDCEEYNEIGSVLNPKFDWRYSSDKILSQEINGKSLDTKLRSYSLTNISEDTKVTLKVKSLNTATSELNINFVPRMYYGVSELESLNEDSIKSLMDDKIVLSNNRALGLQVFDCSGGKYVYYIVPTSDSDKVVIKDGNGYLFNAYNKSLIDVTNDYGVTTNYTIFRMINRYYSKNITFKFE